MALLHTDRRMRLSLPVSGFRRSNIAPAGLPVVASLVNTIQRDPIHATSALTGVS